ncbi:MAG TPA: nuclease-related domain-containing protein [Jatrophihabitans sp.]|nr:nuclease-related domain-containing protein [Jatrophihabitans sp.]
MAAEGGSARARAEALRRMAAEARLKADRMDSMASRWEAGDLGERRVAAALAPLEGRHCRVLHDRLLEPGQSRVNLDHIVVSVAGTYLIDAKNFSGSVVAEGGSLRQRGGSRRLLDDKVDKVRRMAEQMETSTSSVIEPVICLAGDSSAEFGPPVAVRGVFVVPVDQLAPWLLARPRLPSPAHLDTEVTRLAATFPSATEPVFLSISPMLGRRAARPAQRKQPVQPRQPVPPSRGSSRAARARGRHRSSAIKLLICVAVALSMLTGPGQRLWWAGAETAGSLIAGQFSRATAPVPPPAWTPPCTAVSDAAVTAAVGQKVYRYLNGAGDTCSWGFVPRPDATAPGNLQILTGWAAQHSAYPTGTAARFTRTATSVVLTVPQLAAVPGSGAAPASVTQPMLLVLTWKSTPVTSARAELAVTMLAGQVATHLPTGPGATAIVRR